MRTLTSEQVQSFHENGFLIVDDVYTAHELAVLKTMLQWTVRSWIAKASKKHPELSVESFRDKELHEGIIALKNLDTQYIGDIYDVVAQTPEFLRIVSKAEVSTFINQLLDRPQQAPLYSYTCRCRIDPPQDQRRTYGWHQEVFYTVPESRFIQTWAPLLHDLSKERGAIEVRVSSHKEGIPKQSWNEPPGRAIQIIVDEKIVEKYRGEVIEMKLGQLLFFSGKLFHQSGTNTSPLVRYSLVGMYHDIDQPNFRPAAIDFRFKGKTPREYFDEIMKDR